MRTSSRSLGSGPFIRSNDYLGSLFKHKKIGSDPDLNPEGQLITAPAETGSYLDSGQLWPLKNYVAK
jgi:hypothetical protein